MHIIIKLIHTYFEAANSNPDVGLPVRGSPTVARCVFVKFVLDEEVYVSSLATALVRQREGSTSEWFDVGQELLSNLC
jgi:hypothetical protein